MANFQDNLGNSAHKQSAILEFHVPPGGKAVVRIFIHGGGSLPYLSLSLPFPASFPSIPLSSPFPHDSARDLGSAVSSPSGSRQSPADKRFLVNLEHKIKHLTTAILAVSLIN